MSQSSMPRVDAEPGADPIPSSPLEWRGAPLKTLTTVRGKDVELHKAENPWKLNNQKRDVAAKNDNEAPIIENMVKKARGILNKLTVENFDRLVQEFIDMYLPLDDDEFISTITAVVFEKAINEPLYAVVYATFVQYVCKTSQETSRKFRKQILDQCQKEFRKSSFDEAEIKGVEQKLAEATEDDSLKKLKAELEDKKYSSRRRSLSNVRFIGELYKLQMLTPKIMVECVQSLLYAPDEEKMQCACKLLTTVGQKLDLHLRSLEDQAARGRKPKFIPEPNWMDKICGQLTTLSEDTRLSSRVRFAMLDFVDLRGNDWKP